MTVAVVGSRTFTDYALLKRTLECLHLTEIVSGGDSGADQLAETYAQEKHIPIRIIPHTENPEVSHADRTFAIVNDAQMVVAFWNGKSPGTGDLLRYARMKGKKVVIKYFREPVSINSEG